MSVLEWPADLTASSNLPSHIISVFMKAVSHR